MIERSNRPRELTKYQELIELRDRERARIANSSVCVNGRALPLEVNPQGMLKWYMHPAIDSTAHKFLIFYSQEIPPGSHSGKQRSQGGVVFAVVEGAERQKTPHEIALNILLAGLTLVFLFACVTLVPMALYSGMPSVSTTVIIALLVCLIPTTIGGLLSAIGIAGIDRLLRKNVLAMSGRAVEAAGDVDTLLLDKTGTITLGKETYGLVKAGQNLYRVKKGNYMGQNFGVITAINDNEITLKELIQDSNGEWVERTSTLQLQEAKK